MDLDKIADIKLAGRAINEEWPVSSEIRSEVVDKLQFISKHGSPELAIAASRVLLAADALNAKKREAEQRRLEAEHARKLQLIELAVRLGIVDVDGGSTGTPHRIN